MSFGTPRCKSSGNAKNDVFAGFAFLSKVLKWVELNNLYLKCIGLHASIACSKKFNTYNFFVWSAFKEVNGRDRIANLEINTSILIFSFSIK